MSYIFDLKQGYKTSGESYHPIFDYQKPSEPGEEYKEEQVPQEKKSLTQGAYEQMQESEDLERDIERHRARGTSRIGERLLGLPGDIAEFLGHITGYEGKSFPVLGNFPSSSELQKESERLTKGYTSPKNELEKKGDEFMGDVASMMIPGGPGYSMARNIGIPLVGNLAQEGIKQYTGDEKKAAWGKMGLMFALDLMSARRGSVPRRAGMRGARDMGGPQSYVNNLFQQAEHSIPQGAMADVPLMQQNLTAIRDYLEMGGTRTSRTGALNVIDELEQRIVNGQIPVEELPQFRTRINEAIEQLGGWNVEMPPRIRQRAIDNLNMVKREVVQAGEEYGRAQNPQFLEHWTNANEAAAVLNRSNVVSNYIQRNFGNKLISQGAKILFGLGATGGVGIGSHFAPVTTALTAGAIGAGTAVYTGGKFLYRVIQSPTLRRYYANTITAAMNGQKAEMIQNLAHLDKALKEDEDKEKALIEKLTKD